MAKKKKVGPDAGKQKRWLAVAELKKMDPVAELKKKRDPAAGLKKKRDPVARQEPGWQAKDVSWPGTTVHPDW